MQKMNHNNFYKNNVKIIKRAPMTNKGRNKKKKRELMINSYVISIVTIMYLVHTSDVK